MSRVELRTEIAASIQTIFDLARSIDAHVASMSESRERAIAGVTTGLIALGDQVTWRRLRNSYEDRSADSTTTIDSSQ